MTDLFYFRVSPDFELELEMTLCECDYEYSFTSLIAKVSPKRCIFVSICPDGRVRQFEDTEVRECNVSTRMFSISTFNSFVRSTFNIANFFMATLS